MPDPAVISLPQNGSTGPLRAPDLPFERDPLHRDRRDVRSLYLHVPFCVHKCHYCDFYSIVDSTDRTDAFVGRLLAEWEASRLFLDGPLETIFAGGGTPTLLAPRQWERLLAALDHRADDCEFTVEANPETVDDTLARTLAAGGVNRVSIGAQSFDDRHLRTLERRHDPRTVGRCVDRVRAAGIGNVSLDLIFGVPGQTLEDWRRDLDAVLALAPDHLSCYALTYEPNTPLTVRMRAGAIERIDSDLEAAMYEETIDRLGAAGWEHYEISNWARAGRRCRHNLVYWNNAQWWPLGPSASGHAGGWRWKNVPRIGQYLDQSPDGGALPEITGAERLDDDGRVGEALMLGLRLVQGLAPDRLETLLAIGARGDDRREALARAAGDGLVEQRDDRVRLTRRGLLLADSVIAELL